jgi:hypothetical protein
VTHEDVAVQVDLHAAVAAEALDLVVQLKHVSAVLGEM